MDGYSQLPLILGGIAAILTGSVAPLLASLSMFIFAVWSFIVLVVGVREANQFSTLRALASVLIPVVVLVVIFVVLLLGVMAALLGMGAQPQGFLGW